MKKDIDEFIRGLRVLVVEDEDDALAILKQVLSKVCGEVITAQDGREGVDKFAQSGADIIVADVYMPVMDGYEMCKIIKEKNPQIPIIIITAHDDNDTLYRALDVGVDKFLLKPINPVSLVNSIRKASLELFQKEIEKEDMEIRLQEAIIASKGEILQDISHHWRNPLNAISLNAQLLYDDQEEDTPEIFKERAKEVAHKIEEISLKLADTITSFTTVLNSGSAKSAFDLYDICIGVMGSYFDTDAYRDIDINLNVQNVKLYGSRLEMSLILYNLLKNAIDSLENTPEGVIDVASFIEGNRYILSIKDNGCGISAETAKKMFEPYFSTKGFEAGRGLGLFVVKSIAKRGFDAEVKWIPQEKGSEFRIIFPPRSDWHI